MIGLLPAPRRSDSDNRIMNIKNKRDATNLARTFLIF